MKSETFCYYWPVLVALSACSGGVGGQGELLNGTDDATHSSRDVTEREDLTTVSEKDQIEGNLVTQFQVGENTIDIWELDTGGFLVTEAFPYGGGAVYSRGEGETIADSYLRLTGANELPTSLADAMDRQGAWWPMQIDEVPPSASDHELRQEVDLPMDSEPYPVPVTKSSAEMELGAARQALTDVYFYQNFCEGISGVSGWWCVPGGVGAGAWIDRYTHEVLAVACGRPGSATLHVTFAGSIFVPRLDCRKLSYEHVHGRKWGVFRTDWKTTLRASIDSAENLVQFAGVFKDQHMYSILPPGYFWDL